MVDDQVKLIPAAMYIVVVSNDSIFTNRKKERRSKKSIDTHKSDPQNRSIHIKSIHKEQIGEDRYTDLLENELMEKIGGSISRSKWVSEEQIMEVFQREISLIQGGSDRSI
ncbi:hypothetical protein L6452_31128 [Arctium lappa]|uniref:Uncharacterized protein n=1 Tax=Arctium lappa TaxID=4217 RepID=A0ACB8ZL23_ARCLA|nr:hypothetical protein L6452_31128 [Arctium lappa]